MKQRYSKLAIISDCIHTKDDAGNVITENHIYRRQMETLAKHFEHTVIICPFIKKPVNIVATAYTQTAIDFIATRNAGGNTLKDKWHIAKVVPAWLKAFEQVYSTADIFYLRMPANISIPGFFYCYFKRIKTFATYTGTWDNYKGEPFTYRFQKWLLKYLFKGPVFAYITQQKRGKNIFKTCSPSYSIAEWNNESLQVLQRIERYRTTGLACPVFITVGALVPNKNQSYILETCRMLVAKGFCFYWYIVGDGYMDAVHKTFIVKYALQDFVCMTGKKTDEELQELYRASDFLVQATLVEGFGKAPIEAMFHGVIPILSKTAMSEEMCGNGTRGYTFNAAHTDQLINTITKAIKSQEYFEKMIQNGRTYVKAQTLENWAKEIMEVLNLTYRQ